MTARPPSACRGPVLGLALLLCLAPAGPGGVRAAAALALGCAKAAIADQGSADLGFLAAGGTTHAS